MKNFFRHASAFIAPVVVGLVLPYLILRRSHRADEQTWLADSPALRISGIAVAAAGLALFLVTVRTFLRIGRGTIMPWDPTRKLVIAGVYQHVRNPMILSILIFLTGAALLFGSPGIALLAAFFFVVNTVYFIFSEEPGLEKRFGEEYAEYKRNVPRWLPRVRPWRPR